MNMRSEVGGSGILEQLLYRPGVPCGQPLEPSRLQVFHDGQNLESQSSPRTSAENAGPSPSHL
jgi:hypothetical protein